LPRLGIVTGKWSQRTVRRMRASERFIGRMVRDAQDDGVGEGEVYSSECVVAVHY
jgi:hypothetical protein